MQFLAKNQVKLIINLITLETLLNVILGKDTPSKHIWWYIIPLSHAYVYLAWAPRLFLGSKIENQKNQDLLTLIDR